MGWWGYEPWDGDSPADMMISLDASRAACIARLIGVPIKTSKRRKEKAALTVYGDTWAAKWRLTGGTRTKKGILVLEDQFDRWSIVGVVCSLLNADIGLERAVVGWARDQALLVAEDKEFVNSWRSPKAFRASVKRIVTQLSNILEWTTGQTAAIPAWGRVGNLKHGKAKKKS